MPALLGKFQGAMSLELGCCYDKLIHSYFKDLLVQMLASAWLHHPQPPSVLRHLQV